MIGDYRNGCKGNNRKKRQLPTMIDGEFVNSASYQNFVPGHLCRGKSSLPMSTETRSLKSDKDNI